MRLEFINIQLDQDLLHYAVERHNNGIPVYRLYTLSIFGENVPNLIPNQACMVHLRECDFGDSDTYEFDRQYAAQIMSNIYSFIDLFKILSKIEDHEEVIVLTDYTHPNSIPIIDSLIKFIQQRYSLQTIIINEITDIDPLQEFDFESQEGYRNYMNDLGRYYDIMKSTDPRYFEVENRVE